MSFKSTKDRCCNPFNMSKHSGKKQKKSLRRVSFSILEKLDILISDDILCVDCRLRVQKLPAKNSRKCYKAHLLVKKISLVMLNNTLTIVKLQLRNYCRFGSCDANRI